MGQRVNSPESSVQSFLLLATILATTGVIVVKKNSPTCKTWQANANATDMAALRAFEGCHIAHKDSKWNSTVTDYICDQNSKVYTKYVGHREKQEGKQPWLCSTPFTNPQFNVLPRACKHDRRKICMTPGWYY